jgi:hypothetical protein
MIWRRAAQDWVVALMREIAAAGEATATTVAKMQSAWMGRWDSELSIV